MSLKIFHLVFITASVLLALGFAGWAVAAYRAGGGAPMAGTAVAATAAALALVAYERAFLRKCRQGMIR